MMLMLFCALCLYMACAPVWCQCLGARRTTGTGGVRKNRTPCSSLTVTVLAWLLINWHCACHTRHLVGRRPLWHQYRSSSEGLSWRYSILWARVLHWNVSCSCNKNLLWIHSGELRSSNRRKRLVSSLLRSLPAPTIRMPHKTTRWLQKQHMLILGT